MNKGCSAAYCKLGSYGRCSCPAAAQALGLSRSCCGPTLRAGQRCMHKLDGEGGEQCKATPVPSLPGRRCSCTGRGLQQGVGATESPVCSARGGSGTVGPKEGDA